MAGKQQQLITAFVYDKRGMLLATGQNSYTRTHTLMYKAGASVGKPGAIYLHAEVAALIKIKDWTRAHRIFVTRYTKDGKPALAKPCAICSKIIGQTAIREIEYTTGEPT